MKTIPVKDLSQISAAARTFLEATEGIDVVAFSGELGAGKTTFIQALCRELGVNDEVLSPTFALINEYFTKDGNSVYHFDLYRIEDPTELFDMGYEEYFFSGHRCFIEWPEKADHLIPEDALRVEIRVLEDHSRKIVF
jgi:tRNA threonylcarbamoyladenosine biosynthesis protein TsaE